MAKQETKSLLIREYNPQDIQILHHLDSICFPADIAFSRSEMLFYVNHKDSITRIAELNEEVVGFAVGRLVDSSTAHVQTLDVIHTVRRNKIGTALMDALHHEFRLKGAEVSILEVDVANEGARRFYEGLKYEYLEILRGYYGGRSDALRMVRHLTGG